MITLQHHAVERCEVRFYRMDVELLFSRQPFVQGDVERFSWIEPGLVLEVALSSDGRTAVPMPSAFGGSNLVIEVVAAGVRKAVATMRTTSASSWRRPSGRCGCCAPRRRRRFLRPT